MIRQSDDATGKPAGASPPYNDYGLRVTKAR
jgi:hypothetical protein